ncbi:MAG: 2-succinyl-5-enolpyruvyl-6-hydroxy-3-cyclohexene-1-carboxylic-acid synthase [Actinomycetaceae bacterium]|nr:2-succinyl-5-enolpyruvyl-6-hydroxy-3-cyclohexene-1-carboxylic-acid synthase [Actinomycetaceae bacterium]
MSELNGAIGASLDAFFCQLRACGVREAVVSPGSRSTPLAMKALEHLEYVWVDVDERGAAFFALGMAKASGRPVPLICTSGTAVANWYPAVLEAEAARIPLLLLSADRPAHLQNVGAPQTTNQVEMFGSHVRLFRNMPEMTGTSASEGEGWHSDFAAAAREAVEVACGWQGELPGAVQLNFPFNEPLKPAPFSPLRHCEEGEIAITRSGESESSLSRPERRSYERCEAPNTSDTTCLLAMTDGVCKDEGGGDGVENVLDALEGLPVVILAGENSGADPRDAEALLEIARFFNAPILADPLSQMRAHTDPLIVTHYDAICTHEGEPEPAAIIRFGPWGVSKRMVTSLSRRAPVHIAIDPHEPLDYTHTTTHALRARPRDIAAVLTNRTSSERSSVLEQWREADQRAHERLAAVAQAGDDFEGSYVAKMLELIPDNSTLWAGNSMAIRALDTFMEYSPVRVLANRGLNGIDGTTSSALGAHTALAPAPTTLLVGDLTLLHDLNAFALTEELRRHGNTAPFIVICLNNGGGAIFDMLPQRSTEPYFERLFLTPHSADFGGLAQMFGIDYTCTSTVSDFESAYSAALARGGVSLIDIFLPLAGVPERYERFW